jgi:hypothetical protein
MAVLQCSVMKAISSNAASACRLCQLLSLGILIACGGEARAQAEPSQPARPSRTLASLLAEGYEMEDVRLFKDKIWMRKPGQAVAFICDRGRIGSAAFEAYRNRQYDEILCSPTP